MQAIINDVPYNVLIVGAGKIGAFFDRPGSKDVLTHAHAFTKQAGFRLAGFVDTDIMAAQQAAAIWGGQAFSDIDPALAQLQLDVVCLAMPDEFHYEYLKKLASSNIKLILAEKPLCRTLAEAEEIKQLYDDSLIAVAVNYLRCFVPEFIQLRDRIRTGEFGRYISGTGYYGKGFQHNGSHMLNLIEFLLGIIKGGQVISREMDFYQDDPSLSVVLDIEKQGNFYLQNIDCRYYTIFELDLLFAHKRIRMRDSGFYIEEYDIIDSPTFTGYKNLELTTVHRSSLGSAIEYAARNVLEHLTSGQDLLCTLEDGYRVNKICNMIQEDA